MKRDDTNLARSLRPLVWFDWLYRHWWQVLIVAASVAVCVVVAMALVVRRAIGWIFGA